jgi:hypothetical protein
MNGISHERWMQAQIAERKFHSNHNQTDQKMFEMYSESYSQYFDHVGIDANLHGKRIIEIGCADVSALTCCTGFGQSVIIEPMPSSYLVKSVEDLDITLYQEPAETLKLDGEYDEVWLFNVLQHVINPDQIIQNCKKWAHTIRYFEPINTAICEVHPHAFTLGDFESWFGNAKYYDYNPTARNFHTHCCAYGVWTR